MTPAWLGRGASPAVVRAVAGWLLLVGVGCFGSVFGFGLVLSSAFRCDDGCGDPAQGWRSDDGSWVWELLGWSGLALMVLGLVALVVLCVRSWRRWTWGLVVIQAAILVVVDVVVVDGPTPLALLLSGALAAAVHWGARWTRSGDRAGRSSGLTQGEAR